MKKIAKAALRPCPCGSALFEGNAADMKWLGLQVRSHKQHDADHATVEFIARSRLQGRASRLHEISRFVREDGRWLYVDGSFVEKAL